MLLGFYGSATASSVTFLGPELVKLVTETRHAEKLAW